MPVPAAGPLDVMPRFTPWVLGVASITVCAVIWTAASVVKKRIFNDLSFDQPFASLHSVQL